MNAIVQIVDGQDAGASGNMHQHQRTIPDTVKMVLTAECTSGAQAGPLPAPVVRELSAAGLPMLTLEEALRLSDIPMSAAEVEEWARMAADRPAREERMRYLLRLRLPGVLTLTCRCVFCVLGYGPAVHHALVLLTTRLQGAGLGAG